MDDKLILRIDSIITHINKILSDVDDKDFDSFVGSDLLLRATCFSMSQIGEQMIKLEDILKDTYPNVPWKNARGMRNFIVHDYDNIDGKLLYVTIKEDLPQLKESFSQIKHDIKNNS